MIFGTDSRSERAKAAIEMMVANDVFDRLVAARVSLSGA